MAVGSGGLGIESDRVFVFDAPRQVVFETIEQVDAYCTWWPWLRALSADGLVPGAHWTCRIQPPVPYALRLEVTIEDVVAPEWIDARIGGDVEGAAALELARDGERTRARLRTELAPASPVLRAVSRGVRPLARYGHDWVLETAARQFAERALGP